MLANSGIFSANVFASQMEAESGTESQVESSDIEDGTETEETTVENDSSVQEIPDESGDETQSEEMMTDDSQEEANQENSTVEDEPATIVEDEMTMAADEESGAVEEEEEQTLSEGLSWLKNIFESNSGYESTVNNTGNAIYVREAEGLILLSNVDAKEYQDWTITLVTSSTGIWDLTASVTVENQTCSFQGLGTEAYPFQGTLEYSDGGYGGTIQLNRSLFQALDDLATLPSDGFILAATEKMSTPLFINSLQHSSGVTENDLGKITLKGVTQSDNEVSYYDFSGLIGTMEEGSVASIAVEIDDAYGGSVVGSTTHTGLFCNEMKKQASLTVKGYSGKSLNVTSETGSAGGFVGYMNSKAALILSGNTSDALISYTGTVKSTNSYAGGLAGYAENPDFEFSMAFTLQATVSGKVDSGGLVGYYLLSSEQKEDKTIDLNNLNLNGVTLANGNHAGGLFGELYNKSSGSASIEITDTGTKNTITTKRSGGSSSWQYGGLIGEYEADSLAEALRIKDINVNVTMAQNTTAYGGLIGFLPSTLSQSSFTASYVEIDNVSVTFSSSSKPESFGGLVAEMGDLGHILNVGNVTLSGTHQASVDNGGLVGRLTAGVVRLHGITDLTETTASSTGKIVGQIVGTRDNALVYAVGSGTDELTEKSSTDELDTKWMLKRSSAKKRVSDIGSYGEVVRLGEKLKEEQNADNQAELLNYNTTTHVVTVKAASESISDVTDFAALALSIQLNNQEKGSLKLTGSTNGIGWLSKTITLNTDIDLSGTGITGFMRDNGIQTGTTASSGFAGTFEGNNHTVTLAVGEVYGFLDTTPATESDIGSGQIYNHAYLGLFAKTGDGAAIQNLDLTGTIRFDLVNGGEKIYAGALIAQANGNSKGLSLSKVTVKDPDAQTALLVYGGNTQGDASGNIATASIAGLIGEGGTAASSSNTKDTSVKIQLTDCVWSSTLTNNCTATDYRNGGFLAKVYGNGTEITVENCTLEGIIQHTNGSENAIMGGLIASLCQPTQSGASNASVSTVSIHGLTVSDTIKNSASSTTGGLLGYEWWNTNVSFQDMKVSGSTLSSNGTFGGLVYKASGYWKVAKRTAAGIQFAENNTISGKTDDSNPSGLLVSRGDDVDSTNKALYLEIGSDAYTLSSNAVKLTLSSGNYFDELVGRSINENNGNGVVSIATGSISKSAEDGIDINTCNTYTTQLGKLYDNPWTRYYYNVDSYRSPAAGEGITSADIKSTVEVSTIDSGEKLLLWSLSFYAEENIQSCFAASKSSAYTITGTIDLTGISYYPIDYPGGTTISRATFIFANKKINDLESGGYNNGENKKTDTAARQHYMMHTGIFRNIDSDSTIRVSDLTIQGSIGKTKKNENGTSSIEGAGALICGTIEGTKVGETQSDTTLSISSVTLDGITVVRMRDDTSYAPLLINQIGNHVKLNVSNVKTTESYSDTEKKTTEKAATSLIGTVGSDKGAYISLSFSEMALDTRTEQSTIPLYGTYNTIFTRAAFLESFQYSQGNASNCDGSYNFNYSDENVTYGQEISNTKGGSVSGRNNGEQYYYYDADTYVWDKSKNTENDNNAENCDSYFANGYLRYVYMPENNGYWEIDINQRASHIIEGCGTYGDPYIITNGSQLSAMAAHLTGGANDWVICIDPDVMTSQKETESSYHAKDSEGSKTDILLIKTSSGWKKAVEKEASNGQYQADTSDNTTYDNAAVVSYLRNAYYMIAPENDTNTITLGGDSFAGIGGNDAASTVFSGVIIGKKDENGAVPTIKITSPDGEVTQYGGLIKYSQGSVVKDLIVDYSEAEIQVNADSSQTQSEPNFFGGIIGYCVGGDSIIDNVQIKDFSGKIYVSGSNYNLTPVGGYIGLVGGYGVSVTDSSGNNITSGTDFSKGGMVIFRNMQIETDAVEMNVKTDDSTVNIAGEADQCGQYYWNPYAGRVLDGAVCYDAGNSKALYQSVTLNNTDKNYTIPSLVSEDTKLSVSSWAGNSNYVAPEIKVQSAQQLWILSAISISGAGAAEYQGIYWHDYSSNSGNVNRALQAYYYGKVRSGDYDGVGTDTTCPNEVVEDETSWGGVGYKDRSTTADKTAEAGKAPYLIKKYTESLEDSGYKSYPARRITGSGKNFTLKITADCQMSSYGNGFRGIGSGYTSYELGTSGQGFYHRKTIDLKEVNGKKTDGTKAVITLKRQVYEYENDIWNVSQAGLIPDFMVHTENATVSNLTLKGIVTTNNTSSGRAIGLFAGAKKKTADAAKREVTFDNVTVEGTKENKTTVSGGVYSGGIIGNVSYNGNLVFKSCRAIYTDVTAIEKAGGFVGYMKDTGGNNHLFQKCTYSDLSLNGKMAGGFVGYSNKNITVNGKEDTETSDETSILQNIELESSGTSDVGIGGIVGYISGQLTVNDMKIEKISLKSDLHSGGVAGQATNSAVLNNIEINGISSYVTSNGGAGGAIGRIDSSLTASSVCVNNAQIYTTHGDSHIGGIVAICSKSSATMDIDSCVVKNSKFVSGRTAGGILGYTNSVVNIKNTSVTDNYIVMTKTYAATSNRVGAGALVSYLNAGPLKGYNILSKNNVIGYLVNGGILDSTCVGIQGTDGIDFTKITADNVGVLKGAGSYISYSAIEAATSIAAQESNETNSAKIGRWVGYCASGKTVQFVGVSCQGEYIPTVDIGYRNDSTNKNSYFIYADYTGSSVKETETAVVTNPVSSVLGKTVMPDDITVTGDGASVVSETTISIAQKIMSDYSEKWANEFKLLYRNIGDSVSAFQDSQGNYAGSLTTYQKEEENQTEVSNSVDFPLLLITSNVTSEVNAQINSYISLLTNTTDAQKYAKIEPKTYVWDSESNRFKEAETATMAWNGSSLRINSGQYDNEKSQFTLLDVQYADPSDENTTVYHLYLPVLVKKVLNFDFYASVKSGSSYLASDYTSANNRVIASHGDEITAYLTYEYERTAAEWKTVIDNGDSLLWNFSKEISLKIPDGTSLTLVDANNENKAYYAVTNQEYTGSETFRFDDVFGNGNTKQTSVTDDTNWSSVYLCDLLKLAATESDAGNFVEETDVTKATIRVKTKDGYQYFRLADTSDKDEDASKTKYEISVGITGDSVCENYFLTICTPTASAAKKADTGTYVKISSGQGATDWVKNADSAKEYDYYCLAEADDTGEKYNLTSSSVISFQINLPSDSPNKLKGQLPTQRKHTDENSAERNKQNENWYILGKFFNQSLEAKTLNGTAVISEEDPVLQAELITTITLDSASGSTFTQYAGDIPVYQGFSLQLYQYDSSGKATAVEIPKDAQIKVTYSGAGTTSTKNYSSGDFLQYPLPTDNPALIQKAIVSGTVSLKAKIEIYYPSEAWTEQFPMRTGTDDSKSGVEVSAQSKVSFTEDALQTSSMSVTAADSKSGDTHYYREESKHAVLNYNAVNSITTGDGTDGKDVSHLGVNANDTDRNLTMYTQGEYNIMNVVKKDDAKTLCYELQLYCKNEDGTYTENTDSNLLTSLQTSYWKNFSVYRNTKLQNSSITGTIALSDLGDYYDQTEEIIKIPIAFDVLTGSEFEGGDRYYSNYKVVLKMKLQDKDGTIIEGSECSDYIVYTNSSIYMEILSGIAGEN